MVINRHDEDDHVRLSDRALQFVFVVVLLNTGNAYTAVVAAADAGPDICTEHIKFRDRMAVSFAPQINSSASILEEPCLFPLLFKARIFMSSDTPHR